MLIVQYLLTSKSMVNKRNKPSKLFGHISEKSDNSSRKAVDRSLKRHFRGSIVTLRDSSSACVFAPGDLPVGKDVEVEDSNIDDPDPL